MKRTLKITEERMAMIDNGITASNARKFGTSSSARAYINLIFNYSNHIHINMYTGPLKVILRAEGKGIGLGVFPLWWRYSVTYFMLMIPSTPVHLIFTELLYWSVLIASPGFKSPAAMDFP